MKLVKIGSKKNYLENKPFNFRRIRDLDKFDVLTSYVRGESPEYVNEEDKLLMVMEGDVNLRVNKRISKMTSGDMALIESGEHFKFNANSGAKIMELIKGMATPEQQKLIEYACMRHSTREFSEKSVLKKDLYYILKIGMHAPSGANRQPWKFVVVGDPEMKRKIREAAEKVEKKYYQKIKKTQLVKDFKSMRLSWKKPFLENAPYLICIFGNPNQPYYKESLWLAAGWMLLASEEMRLSTLTYTPEDMSFLKRLLEVKDPYIPELIIPIGHASTSDPSMPRKDFSEVVSWVD